MEDLSKNIQEIIDNLCKVETGKEDKYKTKKPFTELLLALRKRGLSDTELVIAAYKLGYAHGSEEIILELR